MSGTPFGRGMLWAIIHRRHKFWPRMASPSHHRRTARGLANLFAGMQAKVSELLAGAQAKSAGVVAHEASGPLPRPAQDDDHALAVAHSMLK